MCESLSRREFGARVAAGAFLVARGSAALEVATAWPRYRRAMVIDMLATPGPFNVPDWLGKPLTNEMVANAQRSGISAVNSTVHAQGATPQEVFEQTVKNIAAWHHEFDAHPDAFEPVRRAKDIVRAKAQGKLGVIFGFQDTTPYDAHLERVELFHRLGVRIVQLTYNGPNLVGDGCLVKNDAGLKPFGREVVAKLNELRTLVDVSHVGWETSRQTIALSRVPIAATHSGAAAVTNVPRNKPDDVLKLLADRGGVVGVYMMPFLRASGQPNVQDFVRHVEHCVNVCGEDHVGIGSDLSISPLDLTPEFRALHARFVQQRRAQGISAPGEDENVFNYVPELNSPMRMNLIADVLARARFSTSRIEKILGQNWFRLVKDVWGA